MFIRNLSCVCVSWLGAVNPPPPPPSPLPQQIMVLTVIETSVNVTQWWSVAFVWMSPSLTKPFRSLHRWRKQSGNLRRRQRCGEHAGRTAIDRYWKWCKRYFLLCVLTNLGKASCFCQVWHLSYFVFFFLFSYLLLLSLMGNCDNWSGRWRDFLRDCAFFKVTLVKTSKWVGHEERKSSLVFCCACSLDEHAMIGIVKQFIRCDDCVLPSFSDPSARNQWRVSRRRMSAWSVFVERCRPNVLS